MSQKKGISLEKEEIVENINLEKEGRESTGNVDTSSDYAMFILIAIILFGIMVAFGYSILSTELKSNLDSMFEVAIQGEARDSLETDTNVKKSVEKENPVLNTNLKLELDKMKSTGD